MKLTQQQIDDFNREGWLFLPELFSPRGSGPAGARGGGHLRHQAPGGVAREERRAAHRLCRASLQRGVRPARRASAHDRSGRADLRREGLHAPVQDQRQIGLHRRRLAVAPGLRHLEARRRHAGAARDEHRDLPRRGDADQRPPDAGAAEPARRRPQGLARSARPPPIRCGRWTRRP